MQRRDFAWWGARRMKKHDQAAVYLMFASLPSRATVWKHEISGGYTTYYGEKKKKFSCRVCLLVLSVLAFSNWRGERSETRNSTNVDFGAFFTFYVFASPHKNTTNIYFSCFHIFSDKSSRTRKDDKNIVFRVLCLPLRHMLKTRRHDKKEAKYDLSNVSCFLYKSVVWRTDISGFVLSSRKERMQKYDKLLIRRVFLFRLAPNDAKIRHPLISHDMCFCIFSFL